MLALATAVLALLAWRKQSGEVRDQADMLRLQAEEFRQLSADRQREAQERRRAQAMQVYMWQMGPVTKDGVIDGRVEHVAAYVRNTSEQPVLNLRITWLSAHGEAVIHTVRVAPLMPGETEESQGLPGGLAVTAIFRDRAGLWWRAYPEGKLEEIPPQKPASMIPR